MSGLDALQGSLEMAGRCLLASSFIEALGLEDLLEAAPGRTGRLGSAHRDMELIESLIHLKTFL